MTTPIDTPKLLCPECFSPKLHYDSEAFHTVCLECAVVIAEGSIIPNEIIVKEEERAQDRHYMPTPAPSPTISIIGIAPATLDSDPEEEENTGDDENEAVVYKPIGTPTSMSSLQETSPAPSQLQKKREAASEIIRFVGVMIQLSSTVITRAIHFWRLSFVVQPVSNIAFKAFALACLYIAANEHQPTVNLARLATGAHESMQLIGKFISIASNSLLKEGVFCYKKFSTTDPWVCILDLLDVVDYEGPDQLQLLIGPPTNTAAREKGIRIVLAASQKCLAIALEGTYIKEPKRLVAACVVLAVQYLTWCTDKPEGLIYSFAAQFFVGIKDLSKTMMELQNKILAKISAPKDEAIHYLEEAFEEFKDNSAENEDLWMIIDTPAPPDDQEAPHLDEDNEDDSDDDDDDDDEDGNGYLYKNGYLDRSGYLDENAYLDEYSYQDGDDDDEEDDYEYERGLFETGIKRSWIRQGTPQLKKQKEGKEASEGKQSDSSTTSSRLRSRKINYEALEQAQIKDREQELYRIATVNEMLNMCAD